VERQIAQAALLRDPEGVAVEVIARSGSQPEAHHMRIVVNDLAGTIDWYSALGYRRSDDMILTPATELWRGDSDHEIVEEVAIDCHRRTARTPISSPDGPGRRRKGLRTECRPITASTAWALAVDSVADAYEALRGAGMATYRPYTFPLPGTPIADGLMILFLRDPNGIVVELVQRPRAHFRPSAR